MTTETVEEFTCNYCKTKTCVRQGTELPFAWIRCDFYHGDVQGIAQDGIGGDEVEVDKHFCPTCRPEIVAQLHALSHRISF